jgi:GNAT superfamily N-acetyltransferase
MNGTRVTYSLRGAVSADEIEIRDLIARSIRTLGTGDYSSEQIEAALSGAFGLDTSLIRDGTYFVAITDRGEIVGCGGWSRRKTLFGSDSRENRDDTLLDPRSEAARIRAFFIDPRHARRGIGRAILERGEAAAVRAGFSACELMATLPGRRLYEKCGYITLRNVQIPLSGGLQIAFVAMRKELTQETRPHGVTHGQHD